MSNVIPWPAIRLVAIDLDGVTYMGDRACAGAPEAIATFRKAGLLPIFLTNNSARRRRTLAAKLTGMGIPVDEEHIVTSVLAVCHLLGQAPRRHVLPLGTLALAEELQSAGIHCVSGPQCDDLVVGFDTDFHYRSICRGLDALLAGARFIACNLEITYPVAGGRRAPGCGPLVAAIACAAQKEPDVVAGKPNSLMLDLIARKYSLPASRILVIGDSLQSDVLMASRYGCPAILVSPDGGAPNLQPDDPRPNLVVSSLLEASQDAERALANG